MARIYPPRPEKAIAPQLIAFYEGRGYLAQVKKNGTCSLAMVDDRGGVEFRTRHWEAHKQWAPTPEVTAFFAAHPDSTFVFELLHSKTRDVKDHAYVFDVLRFHGRDLTGTTLVERLAILSGLLETEKVSVAENHTVGLTRLYEGLVAPEDEGIVLKDPRAKLRPTFRDGLNGSWQVKCRRSTKNYSF